MDSATETSCVKPTFFIRIWGPVPEIEGLEEEHVLVSIVTEIYICSFQLKINT